MKSRWTFIDDRRRYTLELVDGRWVVSQGGETEVVGRAGKTDDPDNDWQLRGILIERFRTQVQRRLRERAVPGSR
jgi:hypothetical protein